MHNPFDKIKHDEYKGDDEVDESENIDPDELPKKRAEDPELDSAP